MKKFLLILIPLALSTWGNAQEGCLDSPNGLNPSQLFVPTCSGYFESVLISGQSGQYSNVQLTAGNTYIFSSSVDTDFITIGNEDGTIVLASGTGPVTYTTEENQIVRFYTHIDEDCTSDFLVTFRNRMVQCGDIQPPVENDECVNAIPLACGDSSSGSTTIATDSGGYPYPDVFYSYTGSGEEEIITVSLCGSDYSTYLRIYTDCDLTNNYAYNNDYCGEQSQVSFVSDGTTTYYILIEGFDGFIGGSNYVGDYEISLTCSPMPEAPENCSDHEVLDNNLEDGYFFEYRTFADIPVGENEMMIEGMELSAFFAGTYFEAKLFTNENSLPGTEIASTTTEILSSEVYGDIEGFEFLNYVLEFDQPLTLEHNTVYWLEVKSDAGGWVITTDSDSRIGRFGMVHDGISFVAPGGEFVYKLICEETLNANDLEKFNFAYYPNPVTDVLNFKSDKEIKSVSVYNLVGQKVLMNSKISNDQMKLSSLPSGTYAFRVELENGQIETFKIIKK